MASKFPVTSKNGNEYHVSVGPGWDHGHELVCEIRMKIRSKIFKNKEWFKKVYTRKISQLWDSYGRYEFDYKTFAMESVEIYENKVEETHLIEEYEKHAKEQNLFEFENWDGKCE